MRKISLTVCAAALSFAAALYADIKYKEVPFKQKIKHDDLTFAATFDKLSLDADFVKSPAKTRGVKDINLALRGAVGFDGKNAYIAEPGEFLRYNAFKNVDPHKGSISFWVAGVDYAPKDKLTNGRKRGNILYAYLHFGNGKDNIKFTFYEYGDQLDVLWTSSAAKHLKGLYSYGLCRTKLTAKQREYFQVVFTWDKNNIALYINGELRSKATLPPKYAMTADLKITEKDSYISIRPRMWDDYHKYATAIDDFKIYKRALNELEIKNEYLSFCKQAKGEIKKYIVDFNGVNLPGDKIDKVEAVFDCSGLTHNERKAPLEYQFFNPDGKCIAEGRFAVKEASFANIFSKVDKVGRYVLKTRCGKYKYDFSFVRPDTSFVGNKYGSEDTVPAVWKDFAVSGRKVTLWNRTYVFGNGPLPEKIYAYGKELLTKCPELKIDGKKIDFKAGKTYRDTTSVTFTGTGKAKDFEIRYKTKVEFDGLIKLDFTVHGKPEIKNMALEWQVAPHASRYLMTPFLQKSGKGEYVWPLYADNSQLWLTSEKQGGFCWTAENDANYRYKTNEKILFADAKTGKCKVNMITIPSKIPEGTPYSALFIATPTRPLAKAARWVGDGKRTADYYPNTYRIFNTAIYNSAFKHVYGSHPGELFTEWAKKYPKGVWSVYNTSSMSSTQHDLAVYVRKYTEIPNAYSYGGTYYRKNGNKYTREKYFSITSCNKTYISDYIMDANMKMITHPYGDRVGMFYYDIAGNSLCNNALHGCQYQDRFGRTVNTFVILSKRDLHMRTVRLAHKYGRTVMLHSQRYFNPILHGMADYWLPGEQHCAMLAKNPHGMIDGSVDEIFFKTEYNKDVIGVWISFYPAITQLNAKNNKPEYTIGAITMFLLHNIDFNRMWLSRDIVDKVFELTLKKYDIFNTKTVAHRFYEQKDIKSDNPKVEITWYDCPAKRRLAVLGNRTPKAQTAVIDASKLFGNADVKEEFYGKTYKFINGKCKLTVPARGFLMLELPNKK